MIRRQKLHLLSIWIHESDCPTFCSCLSHLLLTTADVIQIDIFAACDALHYYARETARILRTERKEH